MDQKIEWMLKFPNHTPVQLSEEHQKEFDLPKHSTVGEVKKSLDANKALENKTKSDVKMVEELKDLTEL